MIVISPVILLCLLHCVMYIILLQWQCVNTLNFMMVLDAINNAHQLRTYGQNAKLNLHYDRFSCVAQKIKAYHGFTYNQTHGSRVFNAMRFVWLYVKLQCAYILTQRTKLRVFILRPFFYRNLVRFVKINAHHGFTYITKHTVTNFSMRYVKAWCVFILRITKNI